MSKRPRGRPLTAANAFAPSLNDRIADRVAQAARALERDRGAPTVRREVSPDPLHHVASLRAVFRELQAAHRQYRARTGQASSPALRKAAHAFKRTPSVASLAAVAAYLDELKLLRW
jgi:hypothetical protein